MVAFLDTRWSVEVKRTVLYKSKNTLNSKQGFTLNKSLLSRELGRPSAVQGFLHTYFLCTIWLVLYDKSQYYVFHFPEFLHSYQHHNIGLAKDCRVGLHWHFCCSCPISRPRPFLVFSSKIAGIVF